MVMLELVPFFRSRQHNVRCASSLVTPMDVTGKEGRCNGLLMSGFRF